MTINPNAVINVVTAGIQGPAGPAGPKGLHGGTARNYGALGDSITAYAYALTSTTFNWQTIGYLTWFRMLMGQGINLPHTNIFALASITTQRLIDEGYLASAVAANLDVCIVMCGTNDAIQSGTAASTTITNLEIIFEDLIASGAHVIYIPILPRHNMTTLAQSKMGQINRFAAYYALNNANISICDMTPIFYDLANPVEPVTGKTFDGTHPSPEGAYDIACKLVGICNDLTTALELAYYNSTDVYDSLTNTTGNMLANGILAGTGGTLGTQVTGVVPNGYTFNTASTSNLGTLAAVCSKVASIDQATTEWLQIDFTGMTTGINTLYLNEITNILTGFSAGDLVEMVADIEIEAGHTALMQVGCQLVSNDGSQNTFTSREAVYYATGYAYPNKDFKKLTARSEYFAVPAGTTNLQGKVSITFDGNIAAAATIRVKGLSVRKYIPYA